MALHTHQTSSAPAINFATVVNPTLTELIGKLTASQAAAEAACTAQSRAEEKFGLGNKTRPRVLGGLTEPMKMTRGKTTIEHPATEWFYSSRESIEKDHATAMHDAKTDAVRAEVETRFAGLLAEWDRQEKANQRAYPKELRAAERAASKAMNVWTGAEQALVRHRPASVTDAVGLLVLAGKELDAREHAVSRYRRSGLSHNRPELRRRTPKVALLILNRSPLPQSVAERDGRAPLELSDAATSKARDCIHDHEHRASATRCRRLERDCENRRSEI